MKSKTLYSYLKKIFVGLVSAVTLIVPQVSQALTAEQAGQLQGLLNSLSSQLESLASQVVGSQPAAVALAAAATPADLAAQENKIIKATKGFVSSGADPRLMDNLFRLQRVNCQLRSTFVNNSCPSLLAYQPYPSLLAHGGNIRVETSGRYNTHFSTQPRLWLRGIIPTLVSSGPLYQSSGIVNATVPYGISDGRAAVNVEADGVVSNTVYVDLYTTGNPAIGTAARDCTTGQVTRNVLADGINFGPAPKLTVNGVNASLVSGNNTAILFTMPGTIANGASVSLVVIRQSDQKSSAPYPWVFPACSGY